MKPDRGSPDGALLDYHGRMILFCHGLESAPIGRKSQGLIDLGYEVVAPDCRGKDLAARVELLAETMRGLAEPPLVVGSSFGGIAGLVAAIMVAREGVALDGLVLCAPALQVAPPPDTMDDLRPPCRTAIVHGTRDEVIPIALSRDYARRFAVELVEVDDDHGLGHAGFDAIADIVARFAQ